MDRPFIMESSLSTAITNTTSSSPKRIYAGLQQIRAIFKSLVRAARQSSNIDLCANFEEYSQLQDSFEYNVASNLVATIERMLTSADTIQHLPFAIDLLRGALLLHQPSRRIFATENNMGLFIKLLGTPQAVDVTIRALVACLLREVPNIRLFEHMGGLATICTLFKRKETPKDVKLKILEFLFFYLIPETQTRQNVDKSKTLYRQTMSRDNVYRLTTEDKQIMLGKYLSNVNGLVRELHESKPFGDMILEW